MKGLRLLLRTSTGRVVRLVRGLQAFDPRRIFLGRKLRRFVLGWPILTNMVVIAHRMLPHVKRAINAPLHACIALVKKC